MRLSWYCCWFDSSVDVAAHACVLFLFAVHFSYLFLFCNFIPFCFVSMIPIVSYSLIISCVSDGRDSTQAKGFKQQGMPQVKARHQRDEMTPTTRLPDEGITRDQRMTLQRMSRRKRCKIHFKTLLWSWQETAAPNGIQCHKDYAPLAKLLLQSIARFDSHVNPVR